MSVKVPRPSVTYLLVASVSWPVVRYLFRTRWLGRERIPDRGYVLAEGRNRIAGRAADLLNDPQVAEAFLGGRRAA